MLKVAYFALQHSLETPPACPADGSASYYITAGSTSRRTSRLYPPRLRRVEVSRPNKMVDFWCAHAYNIVMTFSQVTTRRTALSGVLQLNKSRINARKPWGPLLGKFSTIHEFLRVGTPGRGARLSGLQRPEELSGGRK